MPKAPLKYLSGVFFTPKQSITKRRNKPLKRGNKTYYKAPAVIFGIDEEAGEVVSPNARQLYAAARYFEEHSVKIKTREGEVSVFCFD